jgi:predicted transcriptional regulator
MPILTEDEYRQMWDTYRENTEVLQKFQDERKIEADEIYRFLDQEEPVEAVDQLMEQGLLKKTIGGGKMAYFRITDLGEEILEYDDRESYLEEMESREEGFEETYGGEE